MDDSIRISQRVEWSDHAQVAVEISDISQRLYGPEVIARKPTVVKFGPPTALDKLAADALKASLSPSDASRRLYGPVLVSGDPVSVYCASSASSKTGHTSFALYWGNNSPRNCAYRLEGKQSDARAALFAVLRAVMDSKGHRTLVIFTSSQFAIRSFCYWAGTNANLGWSCSHSDVLKCTTDRIRERDAPVEFRCVYSQMANASMTAAKNLARAASRSNGNVPVMSIPTDNGQGTPAKIVRGPH
ncbi:hypothetical protein DFH06DRAFT_984771 [Mycena polygramma]|nr:hypothetical protein DFH06DRAFT_984771 [Mycena polygramma]